MQRGRRLLQHRGGFRLGVEAFPDDRKDVATLTALHGRSPSIGPRPPPPPRIGGARRGWIEAESRRLRSLVSALMYMARMNPSQFTQECSCCLKG